jgi:hypothetical protein
LEKRYGRIDLDLIELLIKNQSSQSKNLLVGMSDLGAKKQVVCHAQQQK